MGDLERVTAGSGRAYDVSVTPSGGRWRVRLSESGRLLGGRRWERLVSDGAAAMALANASAQAVTEGRWEPGDGEPPEG